MVSKSARATVAALVLLAATSAAADPNPALPAGAAVEPAVLRWQFSYKGPRVSAKGVVSTAALPEPDGSYRILSITGKRNGRRIVELLPAGEVLTSSQMFMFADNRLLPASPFVGEGGFSYRTSDTKYFNVCHAGEDGFCGWKGYREYDGRRGGRPIRLELTRLPDEAPAATPTGTAASTAAPASEARSAGDSG